MVVKGFASGNAIEHVEPPKPAAEVASVAASAPVSEPVASVVVAEAVASAAAVPAAPSEPRVVEVPKMSASGKTGAPRVVTTKPAVKETANKPKWIDD